MWPQGSLLVREAGGQVTDFRGGTDYLWGRSIVAGGEWAHRALLEVIQQAQLT
ncbi:MAG: hypothetical protein KatS3mg026_0472 [Bacteroidia bacterium]|nr:MAG: hypothetical protein KatS3mg026_0472 [Bacteroidia bacterium]